MYFEDEYRPANEESQSHSLQDDYLAALCVAMMFSHIGA